MKKIIVRNMLVEEILEETREKEEGALRKRKENKCELCGRMYSFIDYDLKYYPVNKYCSGICYVASDDYPGVTDSASIQAIIMG